MPGTENIETLTTKEELLARLNAIKKAKIGERCHPFTMKQLNYHAFDKNNRKRYVQFQIPKKKKGEFRTIAAPNAGLKCIQRCLNVLLLERFTAHPAANGFVPGKSIVSNAQVHLGRKFVYNIDLKDFFPSITVGRVYARLKTQPFAFSDEVASIIADLCCHEKVLPQGAPTSPTLTNIICERLDWRLSKLAKRYDLHYSRYADDITFSGDIDRFKSQSQFTRELKKFVQMEGFTINENKTRLNSKHMRQEVTGLTINDKVNVTQQYVKQIRTMLNNWEKSGYEAAQAKFIECYHPKTHVVCEHYIQNILSGKLDYLKMVKGDNDSTYQKLKVRFDNLIGAQMVSEANTKPKTEQGSVLSPSPEHIITTNQAIVVQPNLLDDTLQKLCDSDFDLSIL